MQKVKKLKYCIDTRNHFKGFPFFRKLRRVSFLKSDKQIAELRIDRDIYSLIFTDLERVEISCKKQIGTEYIINDLTNNQEWTFSNPNKDFSLLKKSPEYLLESPNTRIEIDVQNGSFIYSSEKNIIGRIEDKNILIQNGTKRIDVFDEKHNRVLIIACSIELISHHILKVYESND